MANFSKIKDHLQKTDKIDLSQEQVDEIAYRLLVEKQEESKVAIEMQIPCNTINGIRKASIQKEKWLNAIVKWGRLRLIQD